MSKAILLALFVFIGCASQAIAQNAKVVAIPQVMQDWGMTGIWAPNCNQPASPGNSYWTFVRYNNDVWLRRDLGSASTVNPIQDARSEPGGKLALTIQFTTPWLQSFDTYVKAKDGRMRVADIQQNGLTIAKDGKFTNGSQTVWLSSCKTVPGVQAADVSTTLRQWGLEGRWSSSCGQPDATSFLHGNRSVVMHRHFGAGGDANPVREAYLAPDGALDLMIEFPTMRLTGFNRYIKDKDGRIRVFENIQSGRLTVHNGILTGSKAPTPWMMRCKDGAPAVTANAAPAAPATSVALTNPAALPQFTQNAGGRRIALVIGNSQYTAASALANPQRDAATMTATLRAVGFQQVTLLTDLSRDKLLDALRQFASQAEQADWALVYYAGHGMEMNGNNYLIPVDAKLASDRDIDFEAIALDRVMTAVEGAKRLKLVILDACRNNPFAAQMRRSVATRSVGRGLAKVEPEAGTLVVYAARHGQEALDGDGANSPFVSALVTRLKTPGLEIRRLFDLVRDDVLATTNKRQQPFSYGSVPGSEDFFFVARN